jgi:hypothetical protein
MESSPSSNRSESPWRAAARFGIAENSESTAHGMDFMPETKPGRVHVAQPPVTDGSFGLDQLVEVGDVQFGSGHGLEHSHVIGALGGDVVRAHHFREAQERTLEIKEPLIAGGHKLGVVLDFFRPQRQRQGSCFFTNEARCSSVVGFRSTLRGSAILASGSRGIVAEEIIERDQVSGFLQTLACIYYLRYRRERSREFRPRSSARAEA